MTSNRTSEEFPDGQEEFGLGDLFAAILQTRKTIAVAVTLVALGLLGAIFALRVGLPSETTYRHAIKFVFPEVEKGRYPNGLPFSMSDLASPLVLQKVYRMNALDRQNIKLKDFTSAISIAPYATTYAETVAMFRKRLANKRLTFAERVEIEKEMSERISRMSRSNAVVQFRLVSPMGISDELGKKIVHDIPQAWSQISIEKRGVLKLPEGNTARSLIDKQLFSSLDLPVAVDLLISSVKTIKSHINQLGDLAGAETVVDEKSGHTIISLRRDVNNFDKYRLRALSGMIFGLGLVRSPQETEMLFERRLAILDMSYRALEQSAASIEKSLEIYSPAGFKTGRETALVAATGMSQGTSIPQISEGFVDRIITLSQQSRDEQFRKELVTRQLDLKKQAIIVKSEMEIVKQLVKKLTAGTENRPRVDTQEMAKRMKVALASLSNIEAILNQYWQTVSRLYQQLSEKRYSYNGRLYKALSIDRKISNYHPVMTKRTVIIFIAALLATAFLAMFFALVRQMVRKRR